MKKAELEELEGLLDWGRDLVFTQRQVTVLEGVIEHGGIRAYARHRNSSHPPIAKTIKNLKRKAAEKGFSPSDPLGSPIKPGYVIKGTSTLYDSQTGEAKIQWVKTQQDREGQLEQLRDVIEDICGIIKPLEPVPAPKTNNKDLLAVYPMGDPHFGMYAWSQESGKDFDCDIARKQLLGAMQHLVNSTHDAEEALIINLGDFFHSDSNEAETTAGTRVDTDGRWPRVLELGFLAMVDCITLALKRHKRVTVFNEIGNHDTHSAAMLSIALKGWFHNEKRVDIKDTIPKHDYFRFGKVLIGMTHGDTLNVIKRRQLPQVMATDRPEDWGETKKRYWYTGHIHSANKEEMIGCLWESFRNLAPNDMWHQSHGYRSGQDMCAITHHRDHGEVSRVTCDISMLETL